MNRILWLFVLLSAGCATTKPPLNYGHGQYSQDNPCHIINGMLRCIDAPDEKIAAWREYHLEPVIDECEAKSLKRHAWTGAADSLTTALILSACGAAQEANPILAWLPAKPITIPLISYGVYRADKWGKARSSRYQADFPGADKCELEFTDYVHAVRGAVAVRTVWLLAGCM